MNWSGVSEMKEPTIHDQLLETVRIVIAPVLANDLWQTFGYKKRPSRPVFLSKLMPKRRLLRETVLIQEFYTTSYSIVSKEIFANDSITDSIGFNSKMLEVCVLGIDKILWKHLRFGSIEECIDVTLMAARLYHDTEEDEYPGTFVRRVTERLGESLPHAWWGGIAYALGSGLSPFDAAKMAARETRYNSEGGAISGADLFFNSIQNTFPEYTI